MTSRPQFSLGVAGGNEGIPSAHPAQGGGGLPTEFPGLGGDPIGDFMRLEMSPHILHRIEFGRMGRQPPDLNASPGGGDVVFDQQAAMNGRPIPEDQDLPGNMPLEMIQEFNHLKTLDAAGMDLKEASPQGQSTDDREALPIERLVEHRGLSTRSPGARPGRPGAQPAFVNKDKGSALPARLFLRPARPLVSSGPSPCHHAQPPAAPVVGN